MSLEDWRDAPESDVEPLYQAELARWREALDWDFAPSRRIIEQARRAGQLPGFLLRDDAGVPAGWAYYLLDGATLQMGGLVAPTGVGARALLDAVCRSPEAEVAASLSCFLFPNLASIEGALVRQRFQVERHLYLSRPMTRPPSPAAPPSGLRLRPWTPRDGAATVRLLAEAYRGSPEAHCFAPTGSPEEWARYVGQLLHTPACGVWLPQASVAAEDDAGRLAGALVASRIAPGTAHIAQVAVRADLRGRGVGQALVDWACQRAVALGDTRVTLLVAELNDAARALYARLGFHQQAHFLFARRGRLAWRALRGTGTDGRNQPRRSTSDALVGGGAITRR